MRKHKTGPQSFNVTIVPARSEGSPSPEGQARFDPGLILEAALLGAIGAIAGDIGVAAACGEPLSAEEIWADVIAGSAGGIAGALVDLASGNAVLVALVGAFVAGFVSQALFPEVPFQISAV